MASVEWKAPRGRENPKVRLWLDNNWKREYIDYAMVDDDYVVTITEEAARSLYKELGELFGNQNPNAG